MINILSYVGMNMQSEVCLWCLLGLVRTIFDATLFKVNANLKQVWQMTMPAELSMPVQRVLRTMVSGIMLVQCFTVYVYLAAYIVLLYPVFLEERPTLVLPWLLLAAIRKLLCELTSLALGLGTCVLLGAAKPPCIKFVVVKFTSIMPAFYMWMLVFSYYHALKVASAFKTFPAVLPPNDNDYGLELAVRRRRTKSLLGEDQLRKKLVANLYGERTSITNETYLQPVAEMSSRLESTDTSLEEAVPETDVMKPLTMSTTGWSDIGAYEDWFGSEVMIPRDTDRILEQIVLMLLRIGAYLKKEGIESIIDSQILNSAVPPAWHQRNNIDCAAINADDTDTPPLVGSNKGNMASYLREYPQIFMKKQGADIPQAELTIASLKTVHSYVESEEGHSFTNKIKHSTSNISNETFALEVEKVPSKKKTTITDSKVKHEDMTDKLTMPRPLKSKQLATETKKQKTKRNKHLDLESQSKENVSETLHKIKSEDYKKKASYSKILNENNNNELPQGKISITVKTENSADSKIIIKEDKNHELIQNKLLTNFKTQHLENGTTVKENKHEESTHSKVITQDNNNELIQSRTSSNATSQHMSSSKTLNVDKKDVSVESKMLKQDSNSAITQKLKYSKTLQKDRNEESENSKILKQGKRNKTTQSKISTNATAKVSNGSNFFNKGSKVSINSKTKRSTESKIITEDSNIVFTQSTPTSTTSTKILNEDKTEENIDRKTSKQDNNNELTQRKISTNEITKTAQDSKIMNKEKNNESPNSKILKQDHSSELILSNISTNSKAKNSRGAEIRKQHINNKFVPSEIPTNAETQNSLNSNNVNDDKYGSKVLKQDSKITVSTKTQDSADIKIITKDSNPDFIQSIASSNVHTSPTTSPKILNKDEAEESMNSKILKQDDNNEFTNSKISTDKIIQVPKDSKIINETKNSVSPHNKLLKHDNSNELIQSNISPNSKVKSSTDLQIIKQDSINNFVPSEIPSNAKIQNSINSNKLNDDEYEESTGSKLLKQDNSIDFKQRKISNSVKPEESTDTKIIIRDSNTELIKHKTLPDAIPSDTTSTKILYKDKTEESLYSKILKQNNNTEFTNSTISDENVSKDKKILSKDKNNGSSDSKFLKQDNSNELSQSKILINPKAKSSKDNIIIKQNSNNEFVPIRTVNSNKSNEDNNEASMNNKILKQDNKDFAQTEITTYAVAQFSKDSEMLNEDNNKQSIDIQLLNQNNSYDTTFTQSEIPSQISTDGKAVTDVNIEHLTKISNENINTNTILYEEKNQVFKHNEILNDSQGKEFLQNKLRIDPNQSITNSNILNVDKDKEFHNSEMLNNGTSEEFTQSILHLHTSNQQAINGNIANVDNNNEPRLMSCAGNQECTVAEISLIGEDNGSLETCPCSDLNEQSSKEAENSDIKH